MAYSVSLPSLNTVFSRSTTLSQLAASIGSVDSVNSVDSFPYVVSSPSVVSSFVAFLSAASHLFRYSARIPDGPSER